LAPRRPELDRAHDEEQEQRDHDRQLHQDGTALTVGAPTAHDSVLGSIRITVSWVKVNVGQPMPTSWSWVAST
jgi:hypothetical protein